MSSKIPLIIQELCLSNQNPAMSKNSVIHIKNSYFRILSKFFGQFLIYENQLFAHALNCYLYL
jgi:hypothetical protein